MKQILQQISNQQVSWQNKILPCRVGVNDFLGPKQEGDWCTPIGSWKLLTVYYRPDKMSKPKTVLPIIEITSNMGWSDDSDDIAYNTCIT
ncbi:MAG: hypothetical protein NTW22_00400, partial [Proteobacteria bacterium]|nr:hypothetical protein [Pseudomonadota bacterium]